MGSTPKKLRDVVCNRDGWRCWYCGNDLRPFIGTRNRWRSIHVDHLIPRSAGGPTRFWNLVTSCLICNIQKSDHTLEEYRQKRKARLVAEIAACQKRGSAGAAPGYVGQLAQTIIAQGLVDAVRSEQFKFQFYGEALWQQASRATQAA
jgi:hypothetical protein